MISARPRSGSPAGSIVVTVQGVPAGTTWTVTGTAGQWEWTAATATSTGARVHFVDVLAPLGLATTYRLDVTGERTEPVTRPAQTRRDLLTTGDGRTAVEFPRAVDHEVTLLPQVHTYDVPGRTRPLAVFAPVANIGAQTLVVRVEGDDKARLATMLAANRPLIVHHNHATCRLPECDIAPAIRVAVTGAKGRLSRRLDKAERIWDLDVQDIGTPFGHLVPPTTWADQRDLLGTWAQVRDTGMTWAQLAEGRWADGLRG